MDGFSSMSAASPAQAGIDLRLLIYVVIFYCLPRAGGDRPVIKPTALKILQPPPRRRGSTPEDYHSLTALLASPAQAGIDLRAAHQRLTKTRLPRAGGDRPFESTAQTGYLQPPPRRRGSTCRWAIFAYEEMASPAQAGIDR